MLLYNLRKTLEKCFNFFKDKIVISKQINEDEIIIRTLTCPKHIGADNQIPDRKLKDYFLPHSDGGVSVNRRRYADENLIKKLSKKIPGYTALGIFNIRIFKRCIEDYNVDYPKEQKFEPVIVPTPLDEDGQHLDKKCVYKWDKGNLAHADIRFPQIDPENPNIPIRNFSRILAQACVKQIDNNVESDYWSEGKFKSILKAIQI